MSDSPGQDVPMVRLAGVNAGFGSVQVLRDFSLDIHRGEFVAIVGPSGCGKTTLLNLVSGFLDPVSGRVEREGRTRTVYQQDGLFPWLTAGENIALGLRGLPPGEERVRRLAEMIRLIGLQGFGGHYPHQLSGGMRQRVELARAVTGETDILLMDEPFSSLDYLTRLRLRREFSRMLAENPRTVLLVTHDIEEAAQLADRVVVLSDRPARIRCELRPGLERPRDVTHPCVVEAIRKILSELDPQER